MSESSHLGFQQPLLHNVVVAPGALGQGCGCIVRRARAGAAVGPGGVGYREGLAVGVGGWGCVFVVERRKGQWGRADDGPGTSLRISRCFQGARGERCSCSFAAAAAPAPCRRRQSLPAMTAAAAAALHIPVAVWQGQCFETAHAGRPLPVPLPLSLSLPLPLPQHLPKHLPRRLPLGLAPVGAVARPRHRDGRPILRVDGDVERLELESAYVRLRSLVSTQAAARAVRRGRRLVEGRQ